MNPSPQADLYARLPAVDEVLRFSQLSETIRQEGKPIVMAAVRAVLERMRQEIATGSLTADGLELNLSGLVDAVIRLVQLSLCYSLRGVINATGVILHTNLGRAPLATTALDHITEIAGDYSNLEYDLETGERGRRDIHLDRLLRRLLGEESRDWAPSSKAGRKRTEPAGEVSTIVVNNNAAAVLLALNTLAEGGEVIVSRGELVEIGGSFRIPEVMSKSNATLREVGTTNRTRIADYAAAIGPQTRLLLRVHRSNFRILGFTEQPSIRELAKLGRKHNIPVMEDLGSGALVDLHAFGISGEPGVLDSLRAGVDVVTYSGDKLLGGPQAGLISGRGDLVSRMRANSLFRALRVDKMTYAALEATLMAYVKKDHDAIPVLRMMRLSKDEIGARAEALAEKLQSPRLQIELIEGESVVGGGAAPAATLPTRLLAVRCEGLTADQLARALRKSDPPIVARVEENRLLLDLRSIFPQRDEALGRALLRIAVST